MQPLYFGHDGEYQKRKAAGYAGWEVSEEVAKNLADLEAGFSQAHMPKGGELLEIGCGAGDLALRLAERGFRTHGVDISPTAVQWAREKARERGLAAEFLVGEVTDLPYVDARFDVVVDGYCLHCIIGEDRAKTLSEARRVLKPGGLFHVRTMCGDPICAALRHGFDPATRYVVSNGFALRYLGRPEEIVAEIEAAGFDAGHSTLAPSAGGDDQHMLYIDAIKPEN